MEKRVCKPKAIYFVPISCKDYNYKIKGGALNSTKDINARLQIGNYKAMGKTTGSKQSQRKIFFKFASI